MRDTKTTDERKRELIIEIEAIERAIDEAYFTVEVVALSAALAELQKELEAL